MKKVFIASLLTLFALAGNAQVSRAQVVVEVSPVRHNVAVVRPAKIRARAHYIWIAGHWKWNARINKYVWVDGTYVRSRRGYTYKKGHWVVVARGYKWVPGVWVRV